MKLFILELCVGVYFMSEGTTTQKMRLLAGIYQEYDTFIPEEFAIFHSGDSMLVLVLPKLSNQLQSELTRPYRSKCGVYSLFQCINLILEYATPSVASQLLYPEADITLNFLRPFSWEIRVIGKTLIRRLLSEELSDNVYLFSQ